MDAVQKVPPLLRRASGRVLTNSRDVAAFFEKQHAHVLRDIREILSRRPELGASNFGLTSYLDDSKRQSPCYDIDRTGFSLLAMGFTGAKALDWRVLYIQAFDAMEEELSGFSDAMALQDRFKLAQATAGLNSKIEEVHCEVRDIKTGVGELTEDMRGLKGDVKNLEKLFKSRRREISRKTKDEHIVVVLKKYMGLCPHCRDAKLFDEKGSLITFADFDHFFGGHSPTSEFTWLICKPCHTGIHSGLYSRSDASILFEAYQRARRELPGNQPSLF